MTILLVTSTCPTNRAQERILDRMLGHAGITRDELAILDVDQWRSGIEHAYDVIVLAGSKAATHVLGWPAATSDYHGSVLPANALPPKGWTSYYSWLTEPPKYVVTYDIAKLHAVWEWHPLAARDWQKVGEIARGEYQPPAIDRYEWIVNAPGRLHEIVDEDGGTLAFDTELSPVWMFGATTDRQVHVMNWGYECEQPVRKLMQRDDVMKVAHNLQHDLAMCETRFGFRVARPYFDTYGGCTLLNTALERSLSPGLASRYTNYPYHKWLSNYDAVRYNGMDNIVCYEGYYKIRSELERRDLWKVAEHDHDLLEVLYEMQRTGFRVDEGKRVAYEYETAIDLMLAHANVVQLAKPTIRERISAFAKPHLFQRLRQCECCGGGKVTALHCWRCGGLPTKPAKKADYILPEMKDAIVHGSWITGQEVVTVIATKPRPGKPSTVAELRNALPPCSVCQGAGKVLERLAFNPDSPDQVADVLYRGLRIPPRKYKGSETTAAAQLKPLADKYPLVAAIVAASEIRANLDTVKRLSPGTDGRLHCVFDPWGTESGRVASKEGLLEPGTNAMNIPKAARRFVVPDDGYVFLYPDMQQIEARAVAMLSNDPGLRRAFTEPVDWPGHERHGTIDSHTVVQQMISKYVHVTRDQAKRTTYAAIYGVSGKQLAVELTKEAMQKGGGSVSDQQGNSIVEAFFLAFPGVRKWHIAIEQELLRTRTVRSPSGRERHWPGRILDPKTKGVTREILKQAWSYVPQEIGAQVLARGMIRLFNEYPFLTPLIHVHDACLFQCKSEWQPEGMATATDALSMNLFDMYFPCAMKAGANWFEAS